MNKLYTTIPTPKVPRNSFGRSRPNTVSMHFQKVYPTMLEEILPGDLYRVGVESFARLQPMIAPVMNNMKLSHHFFFVPLRTLNKHFAEFMFNNRTGNYAEVLPYVTTECLFEVVSQLNNFASLRTIAANVIRLYDFIGLPFRYSSKNTVADFVSGWINDSWNVQVSDSILRVNLCPFFAYQKIWSEYFRDENVQDDPFDNFEDNQEIDVMDLTGDVSDIVLDNYESFATCFLQLRPRAWAHDRFTSSLPFAQRGPDVLLPVAGTAPVEYKDGYLLGDVTPPRSAKAVFPTYTEGGQHVETKTNLAHYSGNNALMAADTSSLENAFAGAIDPNGSLQVNFDDAALTTTINSFRRAERLQRWYENSARGGVRPNEATLAHFGVKTPDATLDRAEFLGGSMQPIVVSEVAQTSSTDATSPQGNLAGKGTSYKGGSVFKAYFTEHGYIFCMTSALVRANYWQGIPKVFSRMQRDEYYWPEFANLGEEPVFNKELYAGSGVTEDGVFGYVPRYSDYKSAIGEVHGDMRSSLSFWTQTREFSNLPRLNSTFIFGNPSLSPFAVQSSFTDPIILSMFLNVKASRLMPFYGTPTI